MNCPKCKAEMETKKIDAVEIDICTGCGGIFLDDGEFESFTGVDPTSGQIRINKLVKVLTKLNERAILDELTEVYTRKYFNEFLSNVFEDKRRGTFALIAVDIDYFKEINTKYGHDGGDVILKEVAQVVKKSLRTSGDDYLFRTGGEEFCATVFNLGLEDYFNVAETIRQVVGANEYTMPSGEKVKVTLSIGVALATKEDNVESLYKRADELLYKAKDGGRNRVVMER